MTAGSIVVVRDSILRICEGGMAELWVAINVLTVVKVMIDIESG